MTKLKYIPEYMDNIPISRAAKLIDSPGFYELDRESRNSEYVKRIVDSSIINFKQYSKEDDAHRFTLFVNELTVLMNMVFPKELRFTYEELEYVYNMSIKGKNADAGISLFKALEVIASKLDGYTDAVKKELQSNQSKNKEKKVLKRWVVGEYNKIRAENPNISVSASARTIIGNLSKFEAEYPQSPELNHMSPNSRHKTFSRWIYEYQPYYELSEFK